jgi:hypothetical protein
MNSLKQVLKAWNGFHCSGYGSMESFSEHGNAISGCISAGELVI